MHKRTGLWIGAKVTVMFIMLLALPSFISASREANMEIDPLDPLARMESNADSDVNSLDLQRYGRRMQKISKSDSGKGSGKDSGKGISKRSELSPSSKGSASKGTKKSASSDEAAEDVVDFSQASSDNFLFKIEKMQRSDKSLEIPLTLPAAPPTNVLLLTEGDNPNRRDRMLQDLLEISCVDPENDLVFEGVNGTVRVLIPGDEDSSIILCDNDALIGIYYTVITGAGKGPE